MARKHFTFEPAMQLMRASRFNGTRLEVPAAILFCLGAHFLFFKPYFQRLADPSHVSTRRFLPSDLFLADAKTFTFDGQAKK